MNGAFRCSTRLLVPPQVAEHEGHLVVGAGILRIEFDRSGQGRQGFSVEPSIVQDLPEILLDDATLGIEESCLFQPFRGGV